MRLGMATNMVKCLGPYPISGLCFYMAHWPQPFQRSYCHGERDDHAVWMYNKPQ